MSRRRPPVLVLFASLGLFSPCGAGAAAPPKTVVPHGQKTPPGAALSPLDAIKAMTVPDGFSVELVASEPKIVNPVAMTFDERGRIWITESLEYPRRQAGPGRDRVKVLEDTDGDGKADTFQVFADGLNIPSGIAVGHGGVWVANSPDILFLRDTNGDGKADSREVVVTGFGRSDTHELPNSLSWGPDGWLYGWNGVFNPSHIEYRGKTHDFTCAIFRIHPRTRAFEVFCEGTSNPWGLDWDTEGSAFASACVIDHLWHLTETGYYHRQGGPYPPFTWKIESIVGHRHQQAAYCGLLHYDSDAYPERYRRRLFMGNIHGNAINVDRLRRKGSTYAADAEPDLLNAHDPWFMPVSLKTGPDGCLYILDWYDRYHCYQDANRDPAGIDRLKGRLYRVRYKDAPRRVNFDLTQDSDIRLLERLGHPNSYDRETARRLLIERDENLLDEPLETLTLNRNLPRTRRLNALWARISRSKPAPVFLARLLADPDPSFRAWGVRALGNQHTLNDSHDLERLLNLARDKSPDVQLQVAVAARKIQGVDPVRLLTEVASACGNDPLIPHIVWQNLHPLLDSEEHVARFMDLATVERLRGSPALIAIAARAVDRLLPGPSPEKVPYAQLILRLTRVGSVEANNAARQAIQGLSTKVQTGELKGQNLILLQSEALAVLRPVLDGEEDSPLRLDLALLATSLKDPNGYAAARALFLSPRHDESSRIEALKALVAARDVRVMDGLEKILSNPQASSVSFRGQVLAAMGRLDAGVEIIVLRNYARLEPELRPQAVELLSQRESWRTHLLSAVQQGVIPPGDLNVNQIRKLLTNKDPAFVRRVRSIWATVREDSKPDRDRVIREVRDALGRTPGDPMAGIAVFKKVCSQCHKIFGEGQDVGPEITLNGRGSYEQLLSNVFDPSLVIGTAFQATTVATVDGRVLTGLLIEQSPQRIVLKIQGGKTETIPRDQVEAFKVSALSLMPEDLDKQLKPQEIADLFAFLTLDKPPADPTAKPIPGAQEISRRAIKRP